jgi:transcriptional regulator CtsR
MDIAEDVKRIIPCLLRIKEKLSKSLNIETLELAIDSYLLTEWEADFYWDTLGKRKLSLKQENVRKRINKKVLDNLVKQ